MCSFNISFVVDYFCQGKIHHVDNIVWDETDDHVAFKLFPVTVMHQFNIILQLKLIFVSYCYFLFAGTFLLVGLHYFLSNLMHMISVSIFLVLTICS